MIDAGSAWPARQVWDVGALLLAVGDTLAARFGACAVRGEISGYTRAPSGHCYFVLKDSDGAAAGLRCAMFRRAAALLDFTPRDGQQVELRGRIAVYEARGELQLVVEAMAPAGAGSLHERFLRLKATLAAEGLFDAARKRALPRYPATIGVVTSLGAAALHDALSALARRAPQVGVVVYPTPVQGAEAPAGIVAALAAAARHGRAELLILARGGGSLEDLWAFNDERVVRAVAASPLPVVCGVGHETDVTLADFAADLRAPTPTAAAELAAPVQAELLAQLQTLASRARHLLQRRIDAAAQRLDQRALQLARPARVLDRHRRQLQGLETRRRQALHEALRRARLAPQALALRLQRAQEQRRLRALARLQALQGRLEALDPRRVLARGYAWITDAQQHPIVSARGLLPGQAVTAVWNDGSADAVLQRVEVAAPDPDRRG